MLKNDVYILVEVYGQDELGCLEYLRSHKYHANDEEEDGAEYTVCEVHSSHLLLALSRSLENPDGGALNRLLKDADIALSDLLLLEIISLNLANRLFLP